MGQRSARAAGPRARLAARYREIRAATEALCLPLSAEDHLLQSMPDTSPAKWHRAHTTWFFETFVLSETPDKYEVWHPEFNYLFNSYYEGAGERHGRPQRGLLSRPSLEEVVRYRNAIDERMLERIEAGLPAGLEQTVEIGLQHEQQHQELILTDIKHSFASNPLRPVYRERPEEKVPAAPAAAPPRWHHFPAGIRQIGHDGEGFAYDNETPRHRIYLEPFSIASRLVTNGEFLAFMADGGYRRPELWLSDGWTRLRESGWEAPLYWERDAARWRCFTLSGMRDVGEREPVCHVSFYEADAFARWAGARLPGEGEWESAAATLADAPGNFVESGRLHPAPLDPKLAGPPATGEGGQPRQMMGEVWEWTRSAYAPYPGFRPLAGTLGEYNGKFMANQMVLRGGSCVTPGSHVRDTYRNFFYPDARWQFSGIRLARDWSE